MNQLYGFQTNLSTLKRRLRDPLATVRSSNEEIRRAVQEELNSSVSRIGYRRVHLPLVHKGLVVRKHDIRLLVKELDPEGVVLRKRRHLYRLKYSNLGLNFTGHIDGYDKLKYYGFRIHGCIGGFSRKIFWLHISASNKNPDVTAKLYLDTVPEFCGILTYISADDGIVHSI